MYRNGVAAEGVEHQHVKLLRLAVMQLASPASVGHPRFEFRIRRRAVGNLLDT